MTALDRFVANLQRDQSARKRRPPGGVPLALEEIYSIPAGGSQSDPFEVAWAQTVIHEALRRMEAECKNEGRLDIWEVFECRILGPVFRGKELIRYEELVARFDLRSPLQASNLLITAKRKYARCLRAVIGEYARNPEEIENEMADLKKILTGDA